MTPLRKTPLVRGAGPKRKTPLRSSAALSEPGGAGCVESSPPSGSLTRRTRLRPFSARRASERDKRKEVVAAVLERDGHRCQAAPLLCARNALALGPSATCSPRLDVHEIIPRSAWAEGYLVPSNCLTVCRRHHDWIGDHPETAHGLGLHGYSWERGA